ncbi:hypothetical protein SUGI_0262730 [Cryptomeria japonica]|nr:hypothetical protein SUGI_0262730 [Cryptomeria japonica]
MDTSSKVIEHSENIIVTANPIDSCKTELDMSSICKPVADVDASTFANQSNGGGCGITNLETSSFRKSKDNYQPNDDCESSIDNEFTNAMVNDSQASLKLADVSEFEAHTTFLCQDIKEESNVLSPSTTWKPDSPRKTIAACGDIVSETGTCISCSAQNAGNIVRDIPVYDGTTSKDKLSIVSGCSVVTEKMPNFKTSVENEMNCHEDVFETTLKMIEVKDEKNISEGPGVSVVEGLGEERLAQLHQDDKLILEDSFILHTSSFEEKHVSNPNDLADNVKHRDTGSRSDDCINESSGSPLDKMENILKNPEKDGDGDRESGSFSTYQKEINLTVPVRTSQKESVCDSKSENNLTIPVRISQNESVHDSKSHAECLDVRLESSSESTLCKEDNRVETVQFSGDDESRVHPSDSETRSDEYITSHDIHPGENCRIESDESHSFEVSILNDQNSKDRNAFPNSDALNGDKTGINPYVEVDNSLSQGRPFLISEKDGDGDRESGSFSNYQKETNLTIPVGISQKESAHDSKSNAECLDVRLESSSKSTLCKEDNHVETVTMVQFSGDDESRVHPSNSATRSDEYFASHDIHPGENCRVVSDKSQTFEVSTLNDQNSKDRDFASVEFTDGTTVNLSSANKDFDADDLVSKGCSQGLTSFLVPERIGNLHDSFSSSHGLGLDESRISQEDSRGEKMVVAEQSLTTDDQISPVLLHPTKESIKTCDLTEKTLIDSEVTKYDTAKKSDGDNFPPSELASVNTDLKINPENQRTETYPGFSGHPVIEGKAKESIVTTEHRSTCDDQGTLALAHSREEGNGTCGITEKLLNDTKAINHSTSELCVVNNDSAPTVTDIDTKKNVMERGVLTSGFSAHPVSSAYPGRSSHESISGYPVSSVNGGRNSHESLCDPFDDIIGNSDMAESSRYTYSGPISGAISYSGPIPFSGSISHRSDSSTTSTRSFAFPILAPEWNSSPVKMRQADPRYYRKKHEI